MSEVILRTPQQIAWGRFRRNKTGIVSAIVVLFFLLLAYGAPLITRLFGLSSTETYLEGFLKSVDAKLSNEKFVANAKPEMVDKERQKQSDALAKIDALKNNLASL